MLLNLLHCAPAVGGVLLWVQSDCFSFAIAAYLELCIQIGLFPANSGYGALFSRLELSAAVLDRSDAPIFCSGGAAWPFPETETLQVLRQPIGGGSVSWAVDLSPVLALNARLEELNRQLEQRKEYLLEEGRLRQEMTVLETRNELYERVSRAVRPQLELIGTLAGEDGRGFLEKLPQIAVHTAYIKRRSNLELLSADGTLPLAELEAALTESLDHLRLCGVETALRVRGGESLPAAVLISAYAHFHALITESLDSLKAIAVLCSTPKGETALELRLMLQTDNLSWDSEQAPAGGTELRPQVRISVDKQDLVVVLRYPKGGEL